MPLFVHQCLRATGFCNNISPMPQHSGHPNRTSIKMLQHGTVQQCMTQKIPVKISLLESENCLHRNKMSIIAIDYFTVLVIQPQLRQSIVNFFRIRQQPVEFLSVSIFC